MHLCTGCPGSTHPPGRGERIMLCDNNQSFSGYCPGTDTHYQPGLHDRRMAMFESSSRMREQKKTKNKTWSQQKGRLAFYA